MTHVTLFIRAYMTVWFGGGSIAGTVAVIALTGSTGIMEPGAADEGCGGMTEMAIQRCRNVAITHTGRRHTMTGRAIVHDAGMIKHRPFERTGVMTDTAILIC